MPLFNMDGEEMPAVLSGEHWQLFDWFNNSPLHAAIVAELSNHLPEEALDSQILGSQVLGRIRATSPQVFDGFPEEITGGLFGMALWNMLAQHSLPWRFIPKSGGELGTPGGMYYFRIRS